MVLGQILGSIGFVLLLSSPLTFIVAGGAVQLVYFKIILGLALTAFYVITNKNKISQFIDARSASLTTMSWVSAIITIGAVGAINYAAYKHPKEYDLTREGLYTLSDQTIKTLKDLKEEVTAHVFLRTDEPAYKAAKEILERYQKYSSLFKIDFIDPIERPDAVQKYQIKESGPRIVLSRGMAEARVKELSEQELTTAMIQVNALQKKKIYFLAGHGEPQLSDTTESGLSQAKELLQNEGYHVDELNFASTGATVTPNTQVQINPQNQMAVTLKVPEDAQAIIILQPKTALIEAEIKTLSAFAEKGGKLFILGDHSKNFGLEKLADQWHVHMRDDLIIDTNPMSRLLGAGPTMPMAQSFESHPITENFKTPIVLAMARSLEINDSLPQAIAGVTAKPLVLSSQQSWGETGFASGTAQFDPSQDKMGPVVMLAVATKSTASADQKISDEARVVISGDAEFVNNRLLQVAGNSDFFVNTINWLAGDESKISIRPKARGASRIFLSDTQASMIKFFTIDILPVSIFALGMAIRQVRRRK